MKPSPVLEACVETVEQAILAEQNGADRLELCANLSVGGLTPSIDLLRRTQAATQIPIMVMVRPRAGDFVYSPAEINEMKATINVVKSRKLAGVVFGFLKEDREIDVDLTAKMTAYASPLSVTFHKAIDLTKDPVASAQKLSTISGIQRILTSGGRETAAEGEEVLKRMQQATGQKITILVAGKVTKENIEQLHERIGGKEYHGRRIVF